ncbi:hypothetical protein E2C01_056462 [Portunus trituberculatus]|uniref:Uncharacterized protein n=1 Tax=Portunus trituberculatus TaxID=210409 RepID=A0A5B7GZ83_PORTR|nr:hypothetical protein [Portunus trituberculatus]
MDVNYRWSESRSKVCQMCDMGEDQTVEKYLSTISIPPASKPSWYQAETAQYYADASEKCERHSKTSQHSLSGSSGSPVSNCRESHEGGRGVRYRRDSAVDSGPDDNTLSKSLQYLGHPLRPHQPETDPIQTGRSFAPPLLSAAPPQAQSQLDPSTFAAVLFHQPGGTVLPRSTRETCRRLRERDPGAQTSHQRT